LTLIAGLVIPTALLSATKAKADTVTWPYVLPTGSAAPVVTPQGNVVVQALSTDTSDVQTSVEEITPSGSRVILIPPTARYSYVNPVVDGTGDVYTSLSSADPTTAGFEISGFHEGTAKWRVQLSGAITPLMMATANGRLYIGAYNSAWSGTNYPDYLITLNTSDGAIINQATLSFTGCCLAKVFAYKAGAIAIQGGLVQYFTVDGNASVSYPQPSGNAIATAWTANSDGRVFAEGATHPCDAAAPRKLFAFDPDRGVSLNVTLPPGCLWWDSGNSIPLLAPTSDGGVAVANVVLADLFHVTADGTIDWHVPLQDYSWGRAPVINDLRGTSNGHVIFAQTITANPQCSTQSCFMVEVYDVDPSGQSTPIAQARQIDPPTTISDEQKNGVSFASGQLYAELAHLDQQSNATTQYLYKFDANIGVEYPESSLWGQTPPTTTTTSTTTTTIPPTTTTPQDTNLTLTTAVTNYPIDPDPGPNAYVRFKITAKNGDGTPASDATVKLSNSLPTAPPLHTNAFGVLTLLEPVNVTAANAGSPVNITATVTSTSGATATATQELFEADPQVTCSFAGRPGEDLSLLNAMLPDPWGTVAEMIEALGTWAGGLHTDAVGYIVTVPGSRDFYAQSVVITRRNGTTYYSGVGYSYQQILKPPTSAYDGAQRGCGGPKA
jgi:hypothetical protein